MDCVNLIVAGMWVHSSMDRDRLHVIVFVIVIVLLCLSGLYCEADCGDVGGLWVRSGMDPD